MISLDISVDVSRANRKLHGMRTRVVRRAAAPALNRTMTTVRKEATNDLKKIVGKKLGLGASGLKKAIKLIRASAKAGRLVATLVPSGKHLPLINFKARQTKQGVSHSGWGRRQLAKGAFIVKMPGGHKGVFRRTRDSRLPIKELYGPSLPTEFVKQKLRNRMDRTARRVWSKNFRRELAFRLKKLR